MTESCSLQHKDRKLAVSQCKQLQCPAWGEEEHDGQMRYGWDKAEFGRISVCFYLLFCNMTVHVEIRIKYTEHKPV